MTTMKEKEPFKVNSQMSGRQVLLTFKNPEEALDFQNNLNEGCFVKHNLKIKNEDW